MSVMVRSMTTIKRVFLWRVSIFVVAALCFVIAPSVARATTILVNSTADDANPGAGVCTLRAAIAAANRDVAIGGCLAGTGSDTIYLPVGTYNLSVASQLVITRSVNLLGDGAANTIIGSPVGRTLVVDGASGRSVVEGVTWRGVIGSAGALRADNGGILWLLNSVVMSNTASPGGGVWNGTNSITTIQNSAIIYNKATAGSGGGGIFNMGRMTVISSTVSHNSDESDGGGGGGIKNSGILTITSSTLDGNYSASDGGGVRNEGIITVTNSTLSGNWVLGSGGAFYQVGFVGNSALFHNATIFDNVVSDVQTGSPSSGGGIYNSNDKPVTLRQTILANNRRIVLFNSSASDCYGILTSQNNNFIGEIHASCSVTGAVNANLSGDAKLEPLANNGGPLTGLGVPPLTHMPMRDSPVLDSGSVASCGLTYDQRGMRRPLNPKNLFFPTCDIGAVEVGYSVNLPHVQR